MFVFVFPLTCHPGVAGWCGCCGRNRRIVLVIFAGLLVPSQPCSDHADGWCVGQGHLRTIVVIWSTMVISIACIRICLTGTILTAITIMVVLVLVLCFALLVCEQKAGPNLATVRRHCPQSLVEGRRCGPGGWRDRSSSLRLLFLHRC